ncbi:hypothetical protein [Macrococcus capreoli]|uniref:hypothetical protein n=1 Tax=Macrococcus capreoli TaxID=2982690 RepID=UPI003EE7C8C0
MKLKRCTSILYYKNDGIMSDYELLTRYSPYFMSDRIKRFEQQIQYMYDLNTSHLSDTAYGYKPVAVKLEDLAIYIIEEREKLENYRKKCNRNTSILKHVMSGYSTNVQKQIMHFFKSNGSYYPYSIIYQLRKDLYNHSHNARYQRNKAREDARLINIYKHTLQLKQSLHTQREVLTV